MDATLVKDTASIDVIAQALGDHHDLLDYRPKVAKAGLLCWPLGSSDCLALCSLPLVAPSDRAPRAEPDPGSS